MGISRIVNTDFWIDSEVVDHYTPEDRYFWLYLLTNPQTRQLGVYKIPKRIMSFQLGHSLETVDNLLVRFQNTYKTIIYSNETQEIAILNYLKYSIIKGGKPVIDCIKKDISLVKDTSLLGAVYGRIKNSNDKRTTIEEIREMLSIYDNDNDNDNDSIVPRIAPRIVKEEANPTPYQEIVEYLNENNNSNYRHTTKSNKSLIDARFNEGFVLEDFKKVINNKVSEWQGTEFEKFLRPQTLFGTKFESYLNQKKIKKLNHEGREIDDSFEIPF